MQQDIIINRQSSVICLRPSTSVENALQISPFMQNKPNFRKSQLNVSTLLQMAYENKRNWTIGQSKPNSKPIQTQSPKSQNECKLTYNKGLQKKR